ncbi:tyrosine-type recombinase/integrase [Amycolatopsis sp. NPDC023774]|uniref:tyrosine-type recombinase/integrase n=1 Tax=Amycolatopsis sp. NPDC023774 TaxID=3155015 RepID=UPI003407109B
MPIAEGVDIRSEPPRHRHPPREATADMVEEYQHISLAALATKYGVPVAVMRMRLEAAGATIRGRGRPRGTPSTVTTEVYRRRADAYITWVRDNAAQHPAAFTDRDAAGAAVEAWREHLLLATTSGPSAVNQSLDAVTWLYERRWSWRINATRVRRPRRGDPDVLSAVERTALARAARRRGTRDAAIIAVLLDAGARVDECARLELDEVRLTAVPLRIRLRGDSDEVREVPLPRTARALLHAWIGKRGGQPVPFWTGQQGPLRACLTWILVDVRARS